MTDRTFFLVMAGVAFLGAVLVSELDLKLTLGAFFIICGALAALPERKQ